MMNTEVFSSANPNSETPGVLDVHPKDVLANKEKVHLVDVRRPEEFYGELGHIIGSQLLTLDILPQEISSLPKNKPIVFICRLGHRSALAAAFAQKHGLDMIYSMLGGMSLWNELNLEIEK